jgi:malonate-semialdehyde dehydrogenase (acetylating)/methylmalonate-semialdehyde dehydrogenase
MGLVELPTTPIVCRNLIGGQWLKSNGRLLPVVSPYNGATIGEVPLSSAAEAGQAVAKAKAAFPGWRATPIKERSQALFRFRDLMLADLDALSHIAAAEAGKTVAEARAGILKGLEVVEFALSLQNLDSGAAMEVSRGVTCQTTREPLGVVVGITPFNFPAMVPLWMYPIALTLGNCFVLKPSEKVPLTAQKVGELMRRAGYPDGVFSIVNGGREAVEALIDLPDVQAVAFVGSTPVARAVYQRAAGLGKRALALGGAKNHLLVVPDAEPEMTVRGVLDSFTGCAGQRCMAASLLVAVGADGKSSPVDKVIDKLVDAAGRMELGKNMGALIDKTARDRIIAVIERAAKDGAKIRLDGRRAAPPADHAGGNWLGPTVIDHATPQMECAQTEIFGPVLTIVRVGSLSEAMALESSSPFGNATSVFTTSGAVARFVTEHATTGMIGVNIGVPVPREPFSFGGTKESKFGAGDITGVSSLDIWSQLKKVTTKWAAQADANWMS